MLKQLLLVVAVIGVVYCQECPIFSALKNDVLLLNELNGTFYKIFVVGAIQVDACQKQKFINGPNTNLNGYLQSSKWCTRMENCDTSNSAYYECDHTPLTSGFVSLPSTQRNGIKLVQIIEAEDNFCLLYSYCRIGEEATHLICRNPYRSLFPLLVKFISVLNTSLGSNLPLALRSLKMVRHDAGCTYSDKCFS